MALRLAFVMPPFFERRNLVPTLEVELLLLQEWDFIVLQPYEATRLIAKPARPNYNEPSRADIAQLVEHRLPKPRVAGSNPVVRSIFFMLFFIGPSIVLCLSPL